MNSRPNPILTGILLCLAAVAGYQFVKQWKTQKALAATLRPYTIVSADSGYVWKNGSFTEVETDKRTWEMVARKEDGSRAELVLRQYEPPEKIAIENKKLFLSDAHLVSTLDYRAKAKTSSRLKTEEVLAMKSLPKDPTCKSDPNLLVQPEIQGAGKILGYATVKQKFTSQTAIIELELAPDLDCAILYSKVSFLNEEGAVATISERAAISVQEGAPEPWIFQNEEFPEMKPSDLVRQGSLANGANGELDQAHPTVKEKLRRMDAAYAQRR
jgi:hypothetical protein